MADVLLRLRVRRAWNLPKTDAFSLVDPFFKLQTSQGTTFETKHVADDSEPTFDQCFTLCMPCGATDGTIIGTVSFSLFDEETFKDRPIGECELDFGQNGVIAEMNSITLNIALKEKLQKKGSKSSAMLEVGVEGAVYSYTSLKKRLLRMEPGTLCDDEQKRLYVPQEDGKVFLGVEYGAEGIDFRAYQTTPSLMTVVGFESGDDGPMNVHRKVFSEGMEIVPGLVAFSQLKLDGLDLGTDFSSILIKFHDAEPTSVQSVAEVAGSHGWQGALNFERASHKLSDVYIDLKTEEIGMPMFNGEAIMVVDWAKKDADMKLCILSESAENGTSYDLTVRKQDLDKTMTVYNPAVVKFNKHSVAQVYSIDIVPSGTDLADIIMMRQVLSNPRQRPIQDILGINFH